MRMALAKQTTVNASQKIVSRRCINSDKRAVSLVGEVLILHLYS